MFHCEGIHREGREEREGVEEEVGLAPVPSALILIDKPKLLG